MPPICNIFNGYRTDCKSPCLVFVTGSAVNIKGMRCLLRLRPCRRTGQRRSAASASSSSSSTSTSCSELSSKCCCVNPCLAKSSLSSRLWRESPSMTARRSVSINRWSREAGLHSCFRQGRGTSRPKDWSSFKKNLERFRHARLGILSP